jgi:hypothetical protein
MSNTYTPNIALAEPALGDRVWNTALNANASAIDALSPVGWLAVVAHEQPSASLLVNVAPGSYLQQDGTVGAYAGVSGQAVTTATVNYLFLDLTASGNLVVNTTGFPATAHVRLAVVTAGATTINAIADARIAFAVIGSFLDGVNLTFGTVTGTQIGTTALQKLGFFGKAPIVQPVMGAATAAGAYGTNEEGMLQAVYNAVRSLGLGS